MWFVPKICRGRKSYQIFTIFAEQMEPVIILFSDAFRQCCNCSIWGRVNKTLCVETRRIFVVKKFQGKEWTWHGSHPTNSRNSRILSHSFIWKQNRPKWQSSSKARLQGKGIIIQNKNKNWHSNFIRLFALGGLYWHFPFHSHKQLLPHPSKKVELSPTEGTCDF